MNYLNSLGLYFRSVQARWLLYSHSLGSQSAEAPPCRACIPKAFLSIVQGFPDSDVSSFVRTWNARYE